MLLAVPEAEGLVFAAGCEECAGGVHADAIDGAFVSGQALKEDAIGGIPDIDLAVVSTGKDDVFGGVKGDGVGGTFVRGDGMKELAVLGIPEAKLGRDGCELCAICVEGHPKDIGAVSCEGL